MPGRETTSDGSRLNAQAPAHRDAGARRRFERRQPSKVRSSYEAAIHESHDGSECIANLMAFAALNGPSSAADTGWTKLRVGQVAYLAAQLESDNDPNTRPVCRTNAEQIAFLLMEVDDCPHRKWGAVVIVKSILPGFNDDRTTALNKRIPFVEIASRNSGWTGWVQSVSLEPIIPVGTRLVLKAASVYLKKLKNSEFSDAPLKSQVSLGTSVTVEVIRQDPPTDGDCSLLVKALTGPKAGLLGWTCDDGQIEGTELEAGFLH